MEYAVENHGEALGDLVQIMQGKFTFVKLTIAEDPFNALPD